MKTIVSARGRTTIPHEIREQMEIVPRTKLEWEIRDGIIVVYPIPADSVRAARGILKERGPTTQDLLAARCSERHAF